MVSAGLCYGSVAGAGLAVVIGCSSGFNIMAFSAVPLGALAGLFLGVGMQLIEDS